MIDIHCHILPGVDPDGPGGYAEVMTMARMAVHDGVHTIVATPHLRAADRNAETIRDLVDELNAELQASGVPLTILPGAEVSAAFEAGDLHDLTLNNGRYVLLEFSSWDRLKEIIETVILVVTSGLRPIIAHAERIPCLQRQPYAIADLIADGALIQVTAGSLTGSYGVEARICARYLVRSENVHLLASDAHSSIRRTPVLTEGLKVAIEILGERAALRMVYDNPQAVINGRILNS